ncbi:polysaccharide biosynthesis/export family protein [Arachidicoccus sp.]|uniref:polysaccharide biosynthesis/export family protein n=1 Tax=Arachidicoccus sp. TaxID=1872624 RepID=UPI003D22F02D
MTYRFQYIYLFFLIVLLGSSCTSYKNITYFKNISDSSYVFSKGEDAPTAKYHPLKIQADDILKVIISTLDPTANGALNLSSSASPITTGMISSNISSASIQDAGNDMDGYLVNKDGYIEIPVLGTIHVAGLTTDEIKQVISIQASKLYKNPVINVRLANFKVTVLGEVSKPGTYLINGEKASVLDALGLAGDMTIYGKRENLLLMRQQDNNEKKVVRLDLNNTAMLASPYFYLKQGDILYVEPTKGKAAATDASRTRAYTIAGTILSILIVIASRLF